MGLEPIFVLLLLLDHDTHCRLILWLNKWSYFKFKTWRILQGKLNFKLYSDRRGIPDTPLEHSMHNYWKIHTGFWRRSAQLFRSKDYQRGDSLRAEGCPWGYDPSGCVLWPDDQSRPCFAHS